MKKIIFLAFLTSLTMAGMNGWSEDKEAEKAQALEKERLCKIYMDKTEKYKVTMRDDEFAQATLNNYMKKQNKYCGDNRS